MNGTAISVFVLLASAFAWAQPPRAAVKGRLLVGYRPGKGPRDAARLLSSRGLAAHKHLRGSGVSVLQVDEGSLNASRQALAASGMFRFVEQDHIATQAAAPNDPSFASEWHLAKIQAPAAWDISKGGGGVIAIVDSGVDSSHPDLAQKMVRGWNFLNNSSNTSDTSGHGTAVAGAAAAATNNGTGIAGVAWQNSIMPLVVLDAGGTAYYSDIAEAIEYAADHGARIINVSIGGTAASATLQSAVDYAWAKGAVVFAAALNNSSSTPYYPAACNHVVAVSATESNDARGSFSNYGSWITLSAPGDYILTTTKGGGYAQWWGTSLASPVAAGVGALVLGANPALSASALVNILEQNADDLGSPGFDIYFGYGRVNAYRAVLAARGSVPAPSPAPAPSPSPSPQSSGWSPVRVNAGGAGFTDSQGNTWSADTGYSGGFTWAVPNSIGNTSSDRLYQTCRWGTFSYYFAVPDGNYTVNLLFAEPTFPSSGLRQFNVSINGAQVLSSFDVVAAAGGWLTALNKSFPVNVTGGNISIQFTNVLNSALVSGIEIVQGGGGGGSAAVARVNAGGGSGTDSSGQVWSADSGYTGGSTWSTGSAVANTSADWLFQTQRYGVFGYQFFVPNGNYTVNLEFAETAFDSPGARRFNVYINGSQVLADFDIVAAAGGPFKALTRSFPVTVSNGVIDIGFYKGSANLPMVNAIEVLGR